MKKEVSRMGLAVGIGLILIFTALHLYFSLGQNIELSNQLAICEVHEQNYINKVNEQNARIRQLEADNQNLMMYSNANRTQELRDARQVVTGLAFGKYFCVWTEGRNITSVLDTCTHEYAHNNLRMKD